MMVDQRLLDRVQLAIGPRDTFNSADGFSIKLRQEQDTGIHCPWPGLIRHNHRAGAAIPFVAALFRAGEALVFAQKIQKGARGRNLAKPHRRPVQQKRDPGHQQSRRVTPLGLGGPPPMRRKRGPALFWLMIGETQAAPKASRTFAGSTKGVNGFAEE